MVGFIAFPGNGKSAGRYGHMQGVRELAGRTGSVDYAVDESRFSGKSGNT
jgi:hypothetical protein